MNDKAREPSEDNGASPAARRWAARQEEIRAAAIADRERARKARGTKRSIEQRNDDPVSFGLGLLAVLLLFAACWFIIGKMRCDPFYARVVRLPFHACQ